MKMLNGVLHTAYLHPNTTTTTYKSRNLLWIYFIYMLFYEMFYMS